MDEIKDQGNPGIHLIDVLAARFAAARKGEGQLPKRYQGFLGDCKHSLYPLLGAQNPEPKQWSAKAAAGFQILVHPHFVHRPGAEPLEHYGPCV